MPERCEICGREVLDPKALIVKDGAGKVWHEFCLKAALASYRYDRDRLEFVKTAPNRR